MSKSDHAAAQRLKIVRAAGCVDFLNFPAVFEGIPKKRRLMAHALYFHPQTIRQPRKTIWSPANRCGELCFKCCRVVEIGSKIQYLHYNARLSRVDEDIFHRDWFIYLFY